jgi:transglutaminase-like putative cysteine protease
MPWISVWPPETGSVDFDPTNGLIPVGERITIGYGRDCRVSPVAGVLPGGDHGTMSVAVDASRHWSAPVSCHSPGNRAPMVSEGQTAVHQA